jgi:hypothetical protein
MAAITDLATLAITDLADDDWIPVHDLSAGTDKKAAALSVLGPNGTFTPVLAFGGAQTGITYSVNTGRYNRFGSMVYVTITIILTNKGSATGNAGIYSLPYAYAGIPSAFTVWWSGLASNAVTVVGLSTTSSGISLYYAAAAATGLSNLTNTQFANTTTLHITGAYRATDPK